MGAWLEHESGESASCSVRVVKYAALESGHPVTVYDTVRKILVRRNVRRRAGDGAPIVSAMLGRVILTDDAEGVMWARGWKSEGVDLLRVSIALGS